MLFLVCGRINPSHDVKDKAGSSSGGKNGSLATMPGKARPSQASVGMSSEGSLATPPQNAAQLPIVISSQAVAKGLQQPNCSKGPAIFPFRSGSFVSWWSSWDWLHRRWWRMVHRRSDPHR
jgi:hypothetical protein